MQEVYSVKELKWMHKPAVAVCAKVSYLVYLTPAFTAFPQGL